MGFWPFGRKNKKSKKPEDQAMAGAQASTPDRARTESVRDLNDRSISTSERRPSHKDSQKRRRSSTGKLNKAMSETRMMEKGDVVPAVPAIPQAHRPQELNEKSGDNRSNQQPLNPPQDRGNVPSYYFQSPMSASSLQPEKFSVVREQPTLSSKRSANDQGLMRRKSSKRKVDDRVREQEIKAMSSPIPIPKRPSSHQPGIMARDSKRIPGGLNRNFDRPLSDVSLPMQESLHSTMSVGSDQHTFKVSALDALSPRPTIRYSENPRSANSSLGPSRTSTRKDKQPMIPEEGERSRRRIDDLADDMDAETLKELMDRDRRRMEKKRQHEHEKLERRLQRKAEKQREREARETEKAAAVVGQRSNEGEDVGLGIGGTITAPQHTDTLTKATRQQIAATPNSWLRDPSKEHLPQENPFHDSVIGASTSHLEGPTPNDDPDEPFLGTAKEVRLSQASLSPPLSPTRHRQEPSNLSQFSEVAPSATQDIPELADLDQRRDSDTSARIGNSWRSIFRRSDPRAKRGSTDRGPATPSEFSNTSRESIVRQREKQQMPASAFTRIPKARSGTPVRTQSRFKEDLPELPISPPDSRLQSPEHSAPSMLPDIPGSRGNDTVTTTAPLSDIHPAFREQVALTRNASLRANSPEVPSTAVLSQSLASVDSEGSWLTGRPVKRTSQLHPRESAGSLQHRMQDLDQSDDEDVPGTPEAEKYMGSLTPAREEPPKIPERKRPYMGAATVIGGDSEDEDNSFQAAPLTSAQEEGKWHSAVGRHPTIIRQGPGPRMKSREGLLNDFHAADAESTESSPSGDSPISPENVSYPTIQRATSVDIGKGHARHISAGSARLLNLPPRSSGDLKRFSGTSAASGERSPLMPSPRLPEAHDDDVD